MARSSGADPIPRHQSALRTLAKLDPRAAAESLVHALSSDLAGVAKTAVELIRQGNPYVFSSDVVPLLEHPSAHVRERALSALTSLDRWYALVSALRLNGDADARVRDVARGILQLWLRIPTELYVGASPDQAARLRELLDPPPAGLERVAETVMAILNRK